MQLIFHGGAQEVGRSCIELRTEGDRYLLDCGVKFHAGGLDYPSKMFDSRTLDGVFLSHAHMDHAGGLPFFEHFKMSCQIFCTNETKQIMKVLLKDSQKISRIRHLCEAFERPDMKKVFKDVTIVKMNNPQHFRSIKYTYFNAGHIPGSASIKIEAEGKTILYTGDYNTTQTQLMEDAKPEEWGEVDIMITESTYGAREHTNRVRLENAMLQKIEKIIQGGGRVLIPVFAVGRAQEILLLLSTRKWKVPIYLDGMAKKITRITMQSRSPYVRNAKALERMYRESKLIANPKNRNAMADHPGIFVSTSGMLTGGPALTYLDHIYNDPKSAVLLSGYQVQNTTGWLLDKDKVWLKHGERIPVKCSVHRYDFSAHLSRSSIQKAILAANPKILIFNHGNPEAISHMIEWARANTKADIFAPMVGDQIDVKDTTSSMSLYSQDDGYDFPHEHQHGDMCQPASEHYDVEYDE